MIDDPKRIGPIFDPREDARVALAMIRVFIEMHAPPGTLPARLYTGLRATEEAEALIEALRNAPLPYTKIWCRHCGAERPFTLSHMPADAKNLHAAAEIVCDVCHMIAVTLHEK